MSGGVEDAVLHEATQERYLNYALSVITARALPDVRDGLKPVQRRILFACYDGLRLTPDRKHRKSAAVVGEVMAKYHPHGDQSIYDAMVRLAQDFSVRYPLIDGQGNFGSLDGDRAAAMRYTEARLRHLSVSLLAEIGKDTVDFRPNYDGTLREPIVLPATVPNLLINGAVGIAVGMATHIPPHNLTEVVEALIVKLDNPDVELEAIVGPIIQGPDFPTGGQILTSRDELLEIYLTGRGPVETRGEYKMEGARHIVVTSIPYGINKSTLVGDIAEHIRAGKVPQLIDVRDESTDEIRIVLDVKRGANAEAAMAYLYKRTTLQTRFNCNMTALCPTEYPDRCQPRRLGLLEMLDEFLEFRFEVVTRRLTYDLERLEQRIHILEGFILIFDALDEAIALIRASRSKADARDRLMLRFGLDWDQAEAILETKLYRLAQLEVDALRAELEDKMEQAEALRLVLGSEGHLWDVIRAELLEIKATYGDERRSVVTGPAKLKDFSEETYIVDEDSFIMVTRLGQLKRQKSYSDLGTVRVREGDELGWVMPASTRETILLFTDQGRCYTMRVADLPMTTGYGDPVQTRFEFADGECIIGVASSDPRTWPAPSPESGGTVLAVAVSRAGKTLRCALDAYVEPSTVQGRLYMRLDNKFDAGGLSDAVTSMFLSDGTELVSLATRQGRVLLFPVDEVNVLANPGKGVMAIKLDRKDWVLGFELSRHRMEGLVIETNRGRVETVRPNKYQVTKRGNRGREIIRYGHLVRSHLKPLELKLEQEEPDDDELEAGETDESDEAVGVAEPVGAAEVSDGTDDADTDSQIITTEVKAETQLSLFGEDE